MSDLRGSSLLISEVFGPTFQGEGPATGRNAVFIRTAGCPVGCTWCDTKYSWDSREREGTSHTVSKVATDDLAHQVRRRSGGTADVVVVTGGEPLTQQRELLSLVRHPALEGLSLHLETAGVYVPDVALAEHFDLIVVSPKLAHSGVPVHLRINPSALKRFNDCNAWFKFVVQSSADLEEVAGLEKDLNLQRIMIMPEGRNAATVLTRASAISEEVIARGWAMSTRLHVLLWGDEPGR